MSDLERTISEDRKRLEEEDRNRLEGDSVLDEKPRKRPWKLRLAELLLWFAVAVITAVVMVSMSEKLLPSNF